MTALARLNRTHGSRWMREGASLRAYFEFGNFAQAFDFMRDVAAICERLDHHPPWSNRYNTVDIVIYTHSANAVTALDFAWAEAVAGLSPNGLVPEAPLDAP